MSFIVAGLAAVVLLGVSRSQRVLPLVQVDGIGVGGLTLAEAADRLRDRIGDGTVAVTAGESSVKVPRSDLGLVLDAEASAWSAHQHGRTLRGLTGLLASHRWFEAPAVWRVDVATAGARIAALAPQLERPAEDDDLRIVDGRVEAVPAMDGWRIDRAATLLHLQAAAGEVVGSARLEAVVHPVPARRRDVAGAVSAAVAILQLQLEVLAYDPIHDLELAIGLSPEQWSDWVEPDIAEDGSHVSWRVTEAAEGATPSVEEPFGPGHYLDRGELAAAAASALDAAESSFSARVRHAPSTHVVAPGETVTSIAETHGIPYPYVLEANPGLRDRVWPGQELAIPSPDALVPLPPVRGKRVVVDLDAQRMQVLEDRAVKWDWPVSTGVITSPTAVGVFQVQSHEESAFASNWDLWMPHFLGIYRPLPGAAFMNGLHGFPSRHGLSLLWTGDLGRPVTYGCVLLDSGNARLLYEWAEDGVVVQIRKGSE